MSNALRAALLRIEGLMVPGMLISLPPERYVQLVLRNL